MKLPDDILKKIKDEYFNVERVEVLNILQKLYDENSNVGSIEQAIRGLIFIANGQIDLIKRYCLPYLQHDPRDIIMEAEEKAGNPNHWFGISFDQMDDFLEKLPSNDDKSEDDGLSF